MIGRALYSFLFSPLSCRTNKRRNNPSAYMGIAHCLIYIRRRKGKKYGSLYVMFWCVGCLSYLYALWPTAKILWIQRMHEKEENCSLFVYIMSTKD